MPPKHRENFSLIHFIRGIYDWLQFRESFQFDTDLPLEECLQRFNHFDQSFEKAIFSAPTTAVRVANRDNQYHFEINIQLSKGITVIRATRVIAEGVMWSENGITFVNGETRLDDFPLQVFFAIMVAIPLLLFLSSSPAMLIIILLTLIILIVPLYEQGKFMRTDFINHFYDVLDHEYETRLALQEQGDNEFYGINGEKKKKYYG